MDDGARDGCGLACGVVGRSRPECVSGGARLIHSSATLKGSRVLPAPGRHFLLEHSTQ
jgi:hypothetical protein